MLIIGVQFKKPDLKKIFNFLNENEKTQIINMDCFFGKKHVIHSVQQTLKAFSEKRNISKKPEIEFLVRLTGQRQIKKALKSCKPEKLSFFVCWKNSGRVFKKFKKEFEFKEIKLKELSEEEVKKAVERTATFYLSS